MADDPKKHREDRRFISWQSHEIAYAKRRLKALYPRRSAAEIEETVSAVKWMMGASESRKSFTILCDLLLR